jgi:small nuclear ribonucleoprotein (snRNP)-like protein
MTIAPSQLLTRIVDQEVELLLKDNRSLHGRLMGIDDHMNMVLANAHERSGEHRRHLGMVVVRGSNVVLLNVPHEPLPKIP